VNILQATRFAMLDALARLPIPPDYVITDFVALPNVPCPQKNLVDGDARCASVAAASIVAKVTRDRIMRELDTQFPEYGFARPQGLRHAGSPRRARPFGPCPIHRRSFSGVWRQGELCLTTTWGAPGAPQAPHAPRPA
jgi:ribonuclease HII